MPADDGQELWFNHLYAWPSENAEVRDSCRLVVELFIRSSGWKR